MRLSNWHGLQAPASMGTFEPSEAYVNGKGYIEFRDKK